MTQSFTDSSPATSMSRLTPLILATAMFMENLDSNVIATSLAAIANDIGSEPISLKLALTSYYVALAIFIPISGWMADKFGTINVFRVAMLVFVLGSIACAGANSLETFVGARFLQGMGGSMMAPLARLVLIRSTPRSQLLSAMTWLTVPSMVGPLAGPPLGGFLTTYFTWHWIFLINVPVGLIGIWLSSIFLPKTDPVPVQPIDFIGFTLAGLAFSGVVFGLSVLSLPALPLWIGFACAVIGTIAGLAYVYHADRTPHPLLDLSLFRNRLFRASIIGGGFFRLGVGASPFLLPLMLQLSFGLTPFASGMVTFVGAVGAIIAKFLANRVFLTFGFRTVLAGTSLLAGLFLLLNCFYTPDTSMNLIMAVLLVSGFVHSVFWTGINAFGVADIDDKDAGQATAITAVFGQISMALGVALGGGVLQGVQSLRGGDELLLQDFHIAFAVVAVVALLAVISFWRLPPDAGQSVSGHKRVGTINRIEAEVEPV